MWYEIKIKMTVNLRASLACRLLQAGLTWLLRQFFAYEHPFLTQRRCWVMLCTLDTSSSTQKTSGIRIPFLIDQKFINVDLWTGSGMCQRARRITRFSQKPALSLNGRNKRENRKQRVMLFYNYTASHNGTKS